MRRSVRSSTSCDRCRNSVVLYSDFHEFHLRLHLKTVKAEQQAYIEILESEDILCEYKLDSENAVEKTMILHTELSKAGVKNGH